MATTDAVAGEEIARLVANVAAHVYHSARYNLALPDSSVSACCDDEKTQ